ncbi:MAG: guanylate kinase [Velocimicrobium sp.]
MGKIYAVLGKSATGKDTIYKKLLEYKDLCLKEVVTYTTRPARSGEKNGVEYFFTTKDQLDEFDKQGMVIEQKCFHTVCGDWYYYTVNDDQVDLKVSNYLMIITTLERYENTRNFYGKDSVVPIYIELDTGIRLERALMREKQQKEPQFLEICRRFLADEEDFPEACIERLEIMKRYQNMELNQCLSQIIADIQK